MARDGVRFETFYATPLCTPTRMALMTGQYGFRNGYLGMANEAFIPAPQSPQRQIGNHFTHADLLKSQGYKTAMAGKWQLSGQLPNLVYDAGFDEYRMWAYDHNLPAGVIHPAHERPNGNTNRYWHPCLVENGQYLPTTASDYGPNLLNEFVIDFARRHKKQPFFVYYTSLLTQGHKLETPDPANRNKRKPANFQSNVEDLDHLMGELLTALKSEGLDKNTIVIFVGDNGTAGSGKGTVTELGVRVPCIIQGPGVTPGVVSRAVADLTDIMPTLAELSNSQIPDSHTTDGYSLVPVLRGEKSSHRNWIYSYLDDGRLVRDNRWLMQINKQSDGREQFFDCGESRDGSGYQDVTHSQEPEVLAARERFRQILSKIPTPKPREGAAVKSGKTKQPAKQSPPASASTTSSESQPASGANSNSSDNRRSRFTKRDIDNDGFISQQEFMKTIIGNDQAVAEARFKNLDANADQRLSLDEFLENPNQKSSSP